MDIYCTFGGPIDQNAVERFFRTLPMLTEHPDTHIHLLLQTVGGYVGDGVCLYNVFRQFPRPLTIYNAGNISSIGVIAYLGASTRRASENATFMMHRSTMHTELPTIGRLRAAVKTLTIDNERTERIVRQHLRLTPEHWRALDETDLTLSAREALDVGLVDEIAEFTPPTGVKLHAIV